MITREQLIEAFIKELSEETLEESLESFNEWLDYSVKIESIQSIINELWLSFWINELVLYGTIAYYENKNEEWAYRINHIWTPAMQYDSIDELLNELNKFEEQCI